VNRLPTLYIRNVPRNVYAALESRARSSGRSVSAEALEILVSALDERREP